MTADNTFRAMVARRDEGAAKAAVAIETLAEDKLMPGDVVVDVAMSTLNYKDGLGLTSAAPVVRKFPLVLGIDLAGVVRSSTLADWKVGDAVLVNGHGMGETHWGGYAQRARVPASFLTRIPQGYDAADAMTIGTAGYTAMLAIMALERAGLTSDSGPILVTGAAGGVGSTAILLLARMGYAPIASTGRAEEEGDYLRGLGATEVINRDELSGKPRALGKETWAGAIDSVGSTTLANVIARIRYGGAVSACGLAQGMDLPGSVAPFILRGVSLLGIDSVMAPAALREEAWARLAEVAPSDILAAIRAPEGVVGLEALPALGARILAGQVRGRVLVDPNR